jgi:hypothetical protein
MPSSTPPTADQREEPIQWKEQNVSHEISKSPSKKASTLSTYTSKKKAMKKKNSEARRTATIEARGVSKKVAAIIARQEEVSSESSLDELPLFRIGLQTGEPHSPSRDENIGSTQTKGQQQHTSPDANTPSLDADSRENTKRGTREIW